MSIVLDDVDKKLEILLGGAVAANELTFVASYADYVDATPAFTPGANDGLTNGANPVELVGVPGASTQRLVNNISIYNKDTGAVTVTIQYEHAAAHREIVKVGLAVGYSLHFREDQWQVLNTTGCVQMSMGGSVFSDVEGDPSNIDPDDAAADGSSGYAARRDHQHQFTCATPVDTGTTNAEGAASTSARSNHVHALHDHDHTGDAGDGAKLDHGAALDGLGDDDHTQYLLEDGSRGLSGAWTTGQIVTLPNQGLHLLDTGGDHDLIIAPGTDLSADRILTLTTGDAARTITLSGNPTLDDWFDQSVKQAAAPTFAGVTLPAVTFDGLTGANVITAPDNLADALHIVDDGDADEYLRIVTTTGSEEIIFNAGGDDVDFTVQAVGHADALQVSGSDGRVTLGMLTAGFVTSGATGLLNVTTEVGLNQLTGYAQGSIIRGGAADWEALALAAAAGYALVSTATDVEWDQTPTWAGLHTFNAGAAVAAGQGLAMGDASWIGIAGNELMTVNAAGNFTFSGITSLVVPDGCWVGADANAGFVFNTTASVVSVLDSLGVGTDVVEGKFTVEATMTDTVDAVGNCHILFRDTDNANYWKMRLRNTGQMFCMDYNAAGTWSIATTLDRVGDFYITNLGGGGLQDVGADGNGKLYVPFASDRKLKNNIEALTGGLDVIKALRGVTFDWNKKALADVGLDCGKARRQVGLIAQEVVEVIPEAVNEGKKYESYRKDAITPYLIEAVKELDVRLTQLEDTHG